MELDLYFTSVNYALKCHIFCNIYGILPALGPPPPPPQTNHKKKKDKSEFVN
jgi:hypothetical protein